MFKLLKVKNFALLEDLTIDFDSGLTVVTGETGAGKSMIIEAIATLCGNRMEDVLIRSNKDFAEVTGMLTVTPGLKKTLDHAGIEPENEIIIRRRIERGKRQTTYLNDHMISLGLLGELIDGSVDLIGQYENQSLFYPRTHRALLDTFIGLDESLQAYTLQYTEYCALRTQLDRLQEQVRDKDDRTEYLSYQIHEIDKAKIQPDEQTALEQERLLLTTCEKRAQLSSGIIDLLYEKEGSLIELLSNVRDLFSELCAYDPKMNDHVKELNAISASIEEIHRDHSAYASSIEFSKEQLDEVQNRLAIIQSLQKKYGKTAEEIGAYLARIKQELLDIQTREEQIKITQNKIKEIEQALNARADKLTATRGKGAQSLQKSILAKLTNLGMKKARFEIRLETCTLNEYGKDAVEFFISTNPGEDLKPLRKVASGGEISRITLSMKTILSEADKIPTVIFDEVDTGIGGGVAEAVGNLLAELSRNHQVICVTHLPQISVFADTHILVHKEIKDKETFTRITKLDEKKRRHEIARMLGGKEITKKTLEHAAEFLKKGQAR